MAGEVSWVIEQGATFVKTVEVTIASFTVAAARMQVRRTIADSVTLVNLSLGSGITAVTVGDLHTFTIRIEATATAALSFADAVFDFEIESNTGFVYRLLKGDVTLDLEVTR